GHAKTVFPPIQIDEGKKNPKSCVEEADEPSNHGERTAEKMSEAKPQLLRNVASANYSQQRRSQHQSRHGNRLLFHKVRAGNFLVSGLRYLRHAGETQSITGEIASQIEQDSKTQLIAVNIAEGNDQRHEAQYQACPGKPAYSSSENPIYNRRHD